MFGKVSALAHILDGEVRDSGAVAPRMSHSLAGGLMVRLGTGSVDQQDVFLDLGTGDGQMDIEARLLAFVGLGPRLGVLIFAAGMQTIVFLSRLQAPTSVQAEGHLLVVVPLLLAILAISCSSKQGNLLTTSKDLERPFNPFFRGILLAILAFIVVHKTNADFLNPDVSCVHRFWLKDFSVYFQTSRSSFICLARHGLV